MGYTPDAQRAREAIDEPAFQRAADDLGDFSEQAMSEVPVVEELPEAEAERDPVRAAWLRRRERGFGASEIAVVMVALGMRHPDCLASYQRPHANEIAVRLQKRSKAVPVPRLFLMKAGLRRPLAMTKIQRLGIEREPVMFAQWSRMVRRQTAGPDAKLIDPRTIRYADLPVEILPLTDPEEPRLICTPDTLARDILGDLGTVDGKCSFKAYAPKYGHEPECARIQVNAQMAVCSASWGAVVEGEGWSNDYRDHAGEPTGPIVTWPVERDEKLIAEIRKAARLGWERVEELRATVREKHA